MAGARDLALRSTKDILAERPPNLFGKHTNKRRGPLTEPETALIQQFVADQPGGMTEKQVNALATLTRRPKELIIQTITAAREEFASSAVEYVQMHKQATQAALANGDAKSLAVATKAAEWAIEKTGFGGERVVESDTVKPTTGPKIMIGIVLGGKNPHHAEVIDSEIA